MPKSNRLSSLVGFLLVHSSLCNSYGAPGAPCHANIDCESNFCNPQLWCDLPGEVGAPCPAGVHEACKSLRCEGGFCVSGDEDEEYIRSRFLQVNGTNVTAAPSLASGNATRPPSGNATTAPSISPAAGNVTTTAPTANGTWDGTVTLTPAPGPVTPSPMTPAPGQLPATPAPSCPEGNIFDHSGNASGCVEPRPTAMPGMNVSGNASGSVAPRPVSDGANGTVTPRPTPVDANATMAPAPTLPPTCQATEDCGDEGYFCSSINVCEELNCLNWANHTPPSNTTFSEAPCTGEGIEPGTAFCGWDGSCYSYDCNNWYTYGPVAFTGYDPNNPVELVCEDYADGYDENMNSVTFGCRTWQPGNKAPEAISWTHFFNQKCTSSPRNNDDFVCYQNMVNTDYRDFQGGVARLNPPSCDREIYDNEQPLYWYVIQLWQDRKGNVTKYKHGRENTLNSDSFNENLAEKTMFATIISQDEAPEQEFPDESAPGEEESGASSRSVGTLVGLIVALCSLCLA